MEVAPEKVMIAQKWMVEKCNLAAKPAIIATSMLKSMMKDKTPTRAEAIDVSNAVSDGADCLMLFEETASGDHPTTAVTTLAKICVETEKTLNHKNAFNDLKNFT